MRPGIRGGKYWIDRKGNIRYDIKGNINPKGIDMAIEMFNAHIPYFTVIAKNVANKFGINISYLEGQPINDFADIFAAGRLAAIKAYDDYFKSSPQNINLKKFMFKRVAMAMKAMAAKLKSQFNISYHYSRYLKPINEYRDKYYAQHGVYPNKEEIADNITIIDMNSGKPCTKQQILDIIERLESHDYLITQAEDVNIDELPTTSEEGNKLELPTIDSLMGDINKLHKQGKISDLGYEIIKMYLGFGKYKESMNFRQIGEKLKMDRGSVFYQFKKNTEVLKPYFEKYRDLLEKSIGKERIKEFIKLILELNNKKEDNSMQKLKYVMKSHVKAYTKRTKKGKIVPVRDYENKKQKKVAEQNAEKILYTKTSTGLPVKLKAWEDELQATLFHPKQGEIMIRGTWGIVNDKEGIIGYSYDLKSNICLTVPKSDYDKIYAHVAKFKEEKAKQIDKEYEKLIEQLPKRIIKNTPDEKKFKELMGKIDRNYFTGREDEGLNWAIRARNSDILKEAQKYCNHELKTEYDKGFTADVRKKVVRTISCAKCGLNIRDEVSEGLSDEAMWR